MLELFTPLIPFIQSLTEDGKISVIVPIKFNYNVLSFMKYFYSPVRVEFTTPNCKLISGILLDKDNAKQLLLLWKARKTNNPSSHKKLSTPK